MYTLPHSKRYMKWFIINNIIPNLKVGKIDKDSDNKYPGSPMPKICHGTEWMRRGTPNTDWGGGMGHPQRRTKTVNTALLNMCFRFCSVGLFPC